MAAVISGTFQKALLYSEAVYSWISFHAFKYTDSWLLCPSLNLLCTAAFNELFRFFTFCQRIVLSPFDAVSAVFLFGPEFIFEVLKVFV